MPIREFTIQGQPKKPVTGMGVRAQVYRLAPAHNLYAIPLNVKKDLVRIVIKGDEGDINGFYSSFSQYCLAGLKLPRQNVGKLSDYGGVEPDWDRASNSFMLEQLSNGVGYLQSVDKQFRDARVHFDRIYKTLSSVEKQTKALPLMANEIGRLRKEMTSLRKILEKFLEKWSP